MYSETPIFAGQVDNQQVNVAGGATSINAIFTADSNHGGLIVGIILYERGTGARTCRLELKYQTTTTVLKRFTTSGNQYTTTNLLTSTFLPVIDDNAPALRLRPGEILQLVTEGTESNALDVTCFGGSYEYPNAA